MPSENEAARPDPYAILGIHRAATAQEIRRAYRRKTKATHPDRFDKTRQPYEWQKANHKQAELNRAYAALRSGRAGAAAVQQSAKSSHPSPGPPPREHAPRANRGSGAQRATEDRQDPPSTRPIVLLLWRVTGVSLLNGTRQSIIVEAATAEEAATVALTRSIRAIAIAPGPPRRRLERPIRATHRLTSFGRKAVVACILAVICLATAWVVQLTRSALPARHQSQDELVRGGDVGRLGSDPRIPARKPVPRGEIPQSRALSDPRLSAGKSTSPGNPDRLLNIDYRAEELWRRILPLFMRNQAATREWSATEPGMSFSLDAAGKDGGDPAGFAVPATLPDDPLTPGMDLLDHSKPATTSTK